MKQLKENWFSKGDIDVERKRYELLAYLQQSKDLYKQNKLYPFFGELKKNYYSLTKYKRDLISLESSFPKEVSEIDHENKCLIYKSTIDTKSTLMNDLEEIVDYSIKEMRKVLNEGIIIYRYFEDIIDIDTVGVLPRYSKEGFVMIRMDKVIYAYRYSLSTLNLDDPISFFLVTSFKSTLTNTPEKIKSKLIKREIFLLNPATFFVDIIQETPLNETLIPIVKKILFKTISNL